MKAEQWALWGLAWCVGLASALTGWAQDPESPERDVLVYHDGDRVQGKLKAEGGGRIVFSSDRFGELTVPASQAVVIKAPVPNAPAVKTPAAAPAVAVADEPPARSEWYSPAILTARLRQFFNPWTGRFAFSTEAVNDTASRATLSTELTLKRKWAANEVQLKGRYDFSQTAGRTTTDLLKADGLWRHDFNQKGFVLYRPSLEWSRASFRKGVPSDYVLIQQEIGAGRTVYANNKYKLRLGLSENLFQVWSIVPGEGYNALKAESAFIETELKLPWSTLLTERGVSYYSFSSGDAGFENRIELTKKFSETLSAAIRHEWRQSSPDQRAQDYTRLKLLLGVDF